MQFPLRGLVKATKRAHNNHALAPGTAKNKQRDGNPKGDRRPEESTAAGQWKLRMTHWEMPWCWPSYEDPRAAHELCMDIIWCLIQLESWEVSWAVSWVRHEVWCARVWWRIISQSNCDVQHNMDWIWPNKLQGRACTKKCLLFVVCHQSDALQLPNTHKALILGKPTQQIRCTKYSNTSASINQSGPSAYDNAQPHKQHFKS